MFDIGWQELMLIGVVALVVVGPKDLPKALRTGARMLHKARAISREFQNGLAEMAREAELDELRGSVERAARFDLGEELRKAADPSGKLSEEFDPTEFNRRFEASVKGGPPDRPARSLPPAPEQPLSAPLPTPSVQPGAAPAPASPEIPATSGGAPLVPAPGEPPPPTVVGGTG